MIFMLAQKYPPTYASGGSIPMTSMSRIGAAGDLRSRLMLPILLANDQGNLYGGYSIRLIRSRKPADEQAQYDDYIGVTNYMPLGPSD